MSVLRQTPDHLEAQRLLVQVRKGQEDTEATEQLLRRLIEQNPNDNWVTCELAMLLYNDHKLVEAEKHARNGVRLNPDNPQAHNLMGMILTDGGRLHAAEYHYRKALELHPPVGKLCANLGLNLKNQGKIEEARQWYRKSVELEPENIYNWLGWVQLEEVDCKLSKASELLEKAAAIEPNHAGISSSHSILHFREKEYDKALTSLDECKPAEDQQQGSASFYYERGKILDKMQHYDQAFEAFDLANTAVRENPERHYAKENADNLAKNLKGFFRRGLLGKLPRASAAADGTPTPTFIVGFPRSGTTMVEQILTSHPNISAGDELSFIWELTNCAPQLLKSDLRYPECLADLWLGDNLGGLDTFRDYYLRKAELIGVTEPGVPHFTDKMPLNETHLGLISLVFPQSPVIHMIRHPLDVVLSCFFNDLTHGFCCSYSLETTAYHYALIRDLVDHYLDNMDINYQAVRYEDIVDEPEPWVRKILSFIGEPWDERCLSFHENHRYARTASYAQVSEKLYTSSKCRYRNYRKHLDVIIPILEPAISRLGYQID